MGKLIKLCMESDCRGRAWHGELCNQHALQKHRARHKIPPSTQEKLRQGKVLLQEIAHDLGIVLSEETSPVHAHIGRIRSPRE